MFFVFSKKVTKILRCLFVCSERHLLSPQPGPFDGSGRRPTFRKKKQGDQTVQMEGKEIDVSFLNGYKVGPRMQLLMEL